MKKAALLWVMALLAVQLCACGEKAAPVPTTPEPSKIEWNTPERKAFQNTLRIVHDEQYLPGLAEQIVITEPEATIEDEKFAILDIDGDGREELLIRIANTYVAGMCEVIYGYDAQSGTVKSEAWNFIDVTHYPGFLKANASHSHGLAGSFLWPYSILTYNAAEDKYQQTYSVDAWDKSLTDYNSLLGISYPENIDTEHYGCVFLITQGDDVQILNLREFDRWESQLFAGKEFITIPWQPMTRAAISGEQ